MRKFLACVVTLLCLLVIAPSEVCAEGFFRRVLRRVIHPRTSRIVTSPSCGCQPLPVAPCPCAPGPSYTDDDCRVPMQAVSQLPPRDTALVPRPGTGLPSDSGISTIALPKLEAPIALQVPPQTSASLNASADRVGLLAQVASIVLGIFGLHRVGAWVALAVSGLRALSPASSSGMPPEVMAEFLQVLKTLQADRAAVPASTQKPVS